MRPCGTCALSLPRACFVLSRRVYSGSSVGSSFSVPSLTLGTAGILSLCWNFSARGNSSRFAILHPSAVRVWLAASPLACVLCRSMLSSELLCVVVGASLRLLVRFLPCAACLPHWAYSRSSSPARVLAVHTRFEPCFTRVPLSFSSLMLLFPLLMPWFALCLIPLSVRPVPRAVAELCSPLRDTCGSSCNPFVSFGTLCSSSWRSVFPLLYRRATLCGPRPVASSCCRDDSAVSLFKPLLYRGCKRLVCFRHDFLCTVSVRLCSTRLWHSRFGSSGAHWWSASFYRCLMSSGLRPLHTLL